MKILAIYDNGGISFDRYSVFLDNKETKNLYQVLAMSENPLSPLGFCQHCSGMIGKHNGKLITKKDLPEQCKKVLANYNYK